MKTIILFLLVYFCFVSIISYSQTSESSLTITERKDSVGIHYIPLSDNARDNMANIFSTRNKYSYANRLTIGTEISGSYYFTEYPWVAAYGVSIALYAGNSNSSDKRIHGFGELSQLYHTLFDKPLEYDNDTFILYDPGISFFSKSRKFSVDLYHKLSSQPFVNGKQLIAPYKLNFHF